MKPLLLSALLLASFATAAAAATEGEEPALAITLNNDSAAERATKAQLEKLLEQHNLSRWIFTREIVIDEKTGIPHSHPVLTLSTSYSGQDAQFLSAFVHEQLHWFLNAHEEDRDRAIAELEDLFPDLPTQPPGGSNGRFSSYQHVLVCYLEFTALRELVGEEKAHEVIEFWAGHHYRAIYRLVLDQPDKIRAVVEKHNLLPAAPAPAAR